MSKVKMRSKEAVTKDLGNVVKTNGDTKDRPMLAVQLCLLEALLDIRDILDENLGYVVTTLEDIETRIKQGQ